MSFFEKICELFGGCHKTEEYATVTVKKGDTLRGIAMDITGNEDEYTKIMALNPDIKDEDLIYPGQELRVPTDWA